MRKISLIKTSKILLLLVVMTTVFISCSSDDDDSNDLGNWSEKSTFDGKKRSGAASFTIGDKGYIVGGNDADDFLNDVSEYDLASDSWDEELTPFPGAARTGAVGFSIGNLGYVGTGRDRDMEFSDFYSFDPLSNTVLTVEVEDPATGATVSTTTTTRGVWTEIASFPITTVDIADGVTGRYDAIAFSLNGIGYVGTGFDITEQKDFYEYNPATNVWERNIGFGGDKRSGASVFIIDNVAYIGGGVQNGSFESDFYSFDGTTWTELTDLDDEDEDNEVFVTGGVGFSINGKGYLGIGSSQLFFEYTPGIDANGNDIGEWEEATDFQGVARNESNAFTFDDTALVLLGGTGSTHFDDVWEFQPDVLDTEDNE